METLLRILELIRSRNVEVTVTYEEASDSYLFRISKRDVPIKTTVCFGMQRTTLDYEIQGVDLLYFYMEENIEKLEKLTAELHEIE